MLAGVLACEKVPTIATYRNLPVPHPRHSSHRGHGAETFHKRQEKNRIQVCMWCVATYRVYTGRIRYNESRSNAKHAQYEQMIGTKDAKVEM